MTAQNIGFVGVGRMGGRMTRRLLKAGFALTIFDTNESAVKELQALGATVAGSPREVGSSCEIVLVCLPTPAIVHAVTLGPNGVRVRLEPTANTTSPTRRSDAEKSPTHCPRKMRAETARQ